MVADTPQLRAKAGDKRFQMADCRLQISDCPSTPGRISASPNLQSEILESEI
jgi:hypothetical protein